MKPDNYQVAPSNLNHPARQAYEDRQADRLDTVLFGALNPEQEPVAVQAESSMYDVHADGPSRDDAATSPLWIDIGSGLFLLIAAVLVVAVVIVNLWRDAPVLVVILGAALSMVAGAAVARQRDRKAGRS